MASGLAPYLPRLVRHWTPGATSSSTGASLWSGDGSLVSVDISGFTRLSERLMRKGKVGAEELILLISGCFEGLIGIAARHGGDVVKFRGDALLLFFSGDGHEQRAARAANDMQWFIETAAPSASSVGRVALRMSTGINSDVCHFFLVESTHRELVVTGPAATATMRLESGAKAGQVLVSAATAAALDPSWLGGAREGGRLLRRLDPEQDADVVAAGDGVAELPHALELDVPPTLREALAAGVEPEHRQVTAAFVKFSGSDDVLAAAGAEALLERLQLLASAVGDAVGEHGLTWLESDIDENGGKLYLTAGAPATTGHDEEAMLRALKRIVGTDVGLTLRAGVNRGLAFAGDVGALSRRTYAVTGDTVNLAARLAARARAGEILATADVVERARTRYETESRPLLVKGKERAVTAYAVGDATAERHEERTHELPLVGRDAELAALREAIDAARRRQSRLVELVGDAGIGKSRLLQELRAAAVGFQQLEAACEPYGASTPYRALHALLRPLAGITPEMSSGEAGELLKPWVDAVMPDLAPWLPLLAIPFDAAVPSTPEVDEIDPQFVHERLHDAVGQFLARVLMLPTLIVVEDAHWLDDASAFLLRHLTALPAPRPWLVVVTRRPEGASFVADGNGTVLELAPLAAADAARLALAASGETALAEEELVAIGERSGGNALFVRELVAAARDGGGVAALPQTVERLMTARIDTLAPADRTLLRYASVLGASFDLELLEEILRGEVEGLDDLARWERLDEFVGWEIDNRLAFRHDLFRTTAYEGLSFRRRREIHGRVGEALERRAGDAADEQAALLSLHFFEAQEHEKAWRYAVLAGHAAKRTFANVVAAELFERALAAARNLPELPPEHVAATCESLGDVCEVFAHYDRAGEAYAEARRLLAGDMLAQSRLMLKEGRLREAAGRYNDALRWYGRALRKVENLDGDGAAGAPTQVEIELAYASVRHRQGRFADTIRWCERAAEHAEAAGDRRGLAHAFYILDVAHMRLGARDNAYRDRALPIYEEIGDLVGQAKVLNDLGVNAYYEGRWDDAIRHYRRCHELSQTAGDVVVAAIALNNEAEILSDQGKVDDAVPLFEEAGRAFRAARFAAGIPLVACNLGRAAARRGRFEEARTLLDEALGEWRELGAESWLLETRLRLVEAHVLAGAYREAQAEAERVLADAGETAVAAAAERLLGYALLQARHPARARPHLERSLELARGLGNRFEEALTLKALAEAYEPDLAARSDEVLASLRVVSVPSPPLP